LYSQDSLSVTQPPKKNLKLNPLRATMLAAALPGSGQLYNRKYWKVPFVYAGFGAVGYAVAYNTKWYNKFTKAYQDLTDKVPETDSYTELIRGIKPEEYDWVLHPTTYNLSTYSWVKDQMLRQVDYFRKYRDLSYIGIAAWYLITILDANVDASLYDYDIGENLELALMPCQLHSTGYAFAGISLNLKINF
jgi:hypothetical protein